jgi:hypothetical protein
VIALALILIQVFVGHVVFEHLAGVYFTIAVFSRFFNASHYSRLKGIPFLNQLVNAL